MLFAGEKPYFAPKTSSSTSHTTGPLCNVNELYGGRRKPTQCSSKGIMMFVFSILQYIANIFNSLEFLDLSRTRIMDLRKPEFRNCLSSKSARGRFWNAVGQDSPRKTPIPISYPTGCCVLYPRIARLLRI